MKCPGCGTDVVCSTCGAAVDEGARPGAVVTDDGRTRNAEPADAPKADRTFLIVARGHSDLLDQLKEVVGDLGWVRLMEDRRTGETILPREARDGTVPVDPEIKP